MSKGRLNHFKIVLLLSINLLLPLHETNAQDLTWQTIRIKGEGTAVACKDNSVITAYTGNSAAFIFTRFAVQLDPSIPHQTGSEFGACRIRSRVIIPRGFYLAGVTQNTQAGVVKSVGARGVIHSVLALQSPERLGGNRMAAFPGLPSDGRIIERTIKFAPKDEMNEPLLNLNGSYEANPAAVRYQCLFTKKSPTTIDLEFRTAVRGQRKKPGSSVMISVDSSDVQLWVGARLQACN